MEITCPLCGSKSPQSSKYCIHCGIYITKFSQIFISEIIYRSSKEGQSTDASLKTIEPIQEKAVKDTEVAISIRGIEIGREIGRDETLFVNVPESHVRQLMGKFLDELTTDQKQVLREFISLMRKTNHPWWGM